MTAAPTAPVFHRPERSRRRSLLAAVRPGLLAGTSAFLLLLGAVLDSTTLITLAVALAVVVSAAVAAASVAARRIKVQRTIDATEVIEGAPVQLAFGIRGLTRLPVRLEALGADGAWHEIGSAGGTLALTLPVRGELVIGPTQLRVSDDFGIVRRTIFAGRPHPLLVLPAVAPGLVPLPVGGLGGDPEPDGLRTYRPGTPLSRIHWASLARGGELQERAMVSAAPAELPLVVVDCAAARSDAAVDWLARAAAGAVHTLTTTGGCRLLVPGAPGVLTVTAAAGWAEAHRALARMGAGAAHAGEGGGLLRIDASAAPGGLEREPLPRGVMRARAAAEPAMPAAS